MVAKNDPPPQKKTQNTRVLQNVYVKWNSKKNLQHILSIKFLKTTSMPGLQNNFCTKANLSFNYIPANCLKHPCNIYFCFFVEMERTLWAEKSWSLPMAAQGWNGQIFGRRIDNNRGQLSGSIQTSLSYTTLIPNCSDPE